MHDTDPADLIEFATRWASLGDAITEQVARVVESPDCGSCWEDGNHDGVNPAAIEQARNAISGFNAGIDEAIEHFLATQRPS